MLLSWVEMTIHPVVSNDPQMHFNLSTLALEGYEFEMKEKNNLANFSLFLVFSSQHE